MDASGFQVSPGASALGNYAVTALKFTEQKRLNSSERVSIVIGELTPLSALSGYLQASTVLQPFGNVVAEVAAALTDIAVSDVGSRNITVRAHVAVFFGAVNYQVLFTNVTNAGATRCRGHPHLDRVQSTRPCHPTGASCAGEDAARAELGNLGLPRGRCGRATGLPLWLGVRLAVGWTGHLLCGDQGRA